MTKVPISIEKKVRITDLSHPISLKKPIMTDANTNPTKNPPVGPNKYANPPPVANTGKPKTVPSKIYKTVEKPAARHPKIILIIKTTNVCKVTGTGVRGTCILDEIVNKIDPIKPQKIIKNILLDLKPFISEIKELFAVYKFIN